MADRPDAVMLFAAGFGRRMGALTATRPKPLVEVAGRALIDHALALTEAAEIPRRVVNAHYRAEMLVDHLRGSDVKVSVEAPEILDTGGGLKAALPMIHGAEAAPAIFTLNTDAVWTGANPLEALAGAWRPQEMDALLLLVAVDRARGHAGPGDFRVAGDGRLSRGHGHVYTGAQIMSTATLAGIDARVFSLNRVWDEIESRGRLYGLVHDGGWCDVGRPEGIATAEAMLAEAAGGSGR